MLSSIKSSEILKRIFNQVKLKQELKIIIYNKSLQSKLSISIKNYKKRAGKIRLIDNTGKGKEYNIDRKLNQDDLIFEGEFKNRKRNGFGKEYGNGKLIFEGEYKDGKPDGFGKKYDKDGNLVFEGEIFKRERMGRKRKNRRIR